MSNELKRDIIIKAAKELIADLGFRGAPMSLIAAKAGVGAGTIYRYFKTRDMLISELHKDVDEKFKSFVLSDFPEKRPIRETFFYIARSIIQYLKNNPIDYRFGEQFHHSPYGIEFRRNKLFNLTNEFDFCRDLYEKGSEQQIIKDVPLPVFLDLAFAPLIWSLKDHFQGFINLDEKLIDIIVSACWDSVKR